MDITRRTVFISGATGIVSDFVGNSSGCPSGVSGSCYKTASWAIRDGGTTGSGPTMRLPGGGRARHSTAAGNVRQGPAQDAHSIARPRSAIAAPTNADLARREMPRFAVQVRPVRIKEFG